MSGPGSAGGGDPAGDASPARGGWESVRFDLVHQVTGEERSEVHVWPLNDLQPHETGSGDGGCDCPCDPEIEIGEDAMIYIHSAFDGRDIIEEIEAQT